MAGTSDSNTACTSERRALSICCSAIETNAEELDSQRKMMLVAERRWVWLRSSTSAPSTIGTEPPWKTAAAGTPGHRERIDSAGTAP